MYGQVFTEFFSARRLYFVCGKVYQNGHFANKIVHWFSQLKLPIIPVCPKGELVDLSLDSAVTNLSKKSSLKIEKTISERLHSYGRKDEIDGISINFVTPPQVTLSILSELKELLKSCPVISVWFQPGSWNEECINFAYKELRLPENRVISDCILRNGRVSYVESALPSSQ